METNKKVITQIKKDINKYKKTVILDVKKNGLCENSGEKEYRKLCDKYSNFRYKKEFELIKEFFDWMINYTPFN